MPVNAAETDQTQNLDSAFQAALSQYNSGHYLEAADQLEELLRQVPQSFEVHELLGMVYAAESQETKANDHLAKAVRLKPDSAEARTNLATNLVHLGKVATAETEFRKAVDLDPGSYDTEVWTEVVKPKAQRRPGLLKEYMNSTQAMLTTTDKISSALALSVIHEDSTFDHLLAIKQMAWLLRNTAGDASLVISNGYITGTISQEGMQSYMKSVGGIDTAWNALQLSLTGMQASPDRALGRACGHQDRLFRGAISQAPRRSRENDVEPGRSRSWWPTNGARSPCDAWAVGDSGGSALDSAKDHAQAQYSTAVGFADRAIGFARSAAIVLAFAAMTLVTRRVIGPLHTIRDAMLKVAVAICRRHGYGQRHDEIGALADALETFKQRPMTRSRSRRRSASECRRRRTPAGGRNLSAQSSKARCARPCSSLAMRPARCGRRPGISRGVAPDQCPREVAPRPRAMRRSAWSVAAAAEELSASIGDISKQASMRPAIASRAVDQARKTDGTVQGLAHRRAGSARSSA